jgi:carboxypeptidase C (cathepsin A)
VSARAGPRTAATIAAIALGLVCSAPAAAADSPAPAESLAGAPAPSWPADSVTRHQTVIDGRAVAYQATAGTLALTAPDGRPTGRMFYVAYVADQPKGAPERPVTFVYNGGPGSSSVWLHMGAFAPVRVVTAFPQPTAPAHGALVDNAYGLLDKTDLVFLDAISTGYSRASDAAAAKGFMGIDEDVAGFAQAVRLYLDQNDRWRSPKFLMGESYGTTRSAALAYRLQAEAIDLNGVVLISSILNFGDLAPGLDRGQVNLIPTFAAIALYHHKAAADGDQDGFLDQARAFAEGPYATALAKGHNVGAAEKAVVAAQLSRYTGLSADYLIRANLRIDAGRFRSELLRGAGEGVGALDGRAVGYEADNAGERPDFDPAESANPAYVAAFHDYLARELNYRTPMAYVVEDPGLEQVWDWSHQPPAGDKQISMADVALDLAAAMRRNPHLKVLSLNGDYDLITPMFATEHDLAHMLLPAPLVGNIAIRHYPAGHMIYLNPEALARIRSDLAAFYDAATAP